MGPIGSPGKWLRNNSEERRRNGHLHWAHPDTVAQPAYYELSPQPYSVRNVTGSRKWLFTSIYSDVKNAWSYTSVPPQVSVKW